MSHTRLEDINCAFHYSWKSEFKATNYIMFDFAAFQLEAGKSRWTLLLVSYRYHHQPITAYDDKLPMVNVAQYLGYVFLITLQTDQVDNKKSLDTVFTQF